jgi:hypothetical protein
VVPRDLSIIGVDDIPMGSRSMISLTTVRQSISEIGALAARPVKLGSRRRASAMADYASSILPSSAYAAATPA